MSIGRYPDSHRFKPDTDENHGTHSLPKEFWTTKSEEKEELRRRRKIKAERTARNKIIHAAWNQFRDGDGSKPMEPEPIGGKTYFDKHGTRHTSSTRQRGRG